MDIKVGMSVRVTSNCKSKGRVGEVVRIYDYGVAIVQLEPDPFNDPQIRELDFSVKSLIPIFRNRNENHKGDSSMSINVGDQVKVKNMNSVYFGRIGIVEDVGFGKGAKVRIEQVHGCDICRWYSVSSLEVINPTHKTATQTNTNKEQLYLLIDFEERETEVMNKTEVEDEINLHIEKFGDHEQVLEDFKIFKINDEAEEVEPDMRVSL